MMLMLMLPVAVAPVTGLRFGEADAAVGYWWALSHSRDAKNEFL